MGPTFSWTIECGICVDMPRTMSISTAAAALYRALPPSLPSEIKFARALEAAELNSDLSATKAVLLDRALSRLRLGDYDGAYESAESCGKIAASREERRDVGRAQLVQGVAARRRGQLEEAHELNHQALLIALENDDAGSVVLALSNAAAVMASSGRVLQATSLLEHATTLLPAGSGGAFRGVVLARLGLLKLHESDYVGAAETLTEALEALRSAKDDSASAQCLLCLGLALEASGLQLDADLKYELVLQLALKSEDQLCAGRAHLALCRAHHRGGRMVLAAQHARKGLVFGQGCADTMGMLTAHHMLGVLLCRVAKDHTKGMEHLQLSLQLAHQLRNAQLCVIGYHALGEAFQALSHRAAELYEPKAGSAWKSYTRQFAPAVEQDLWGVETNRIDPTHCYSSQRQRAPEKASPWVYMSFGEFESKIKSFVDCNEPFKEALQPLVHCTELTEAPHPEPVLETEGEEQLRRLREGLGAARARRGEQQAQVDAGLEELRRAGQDLEVWGMTEGELLRLQSIPAQVGAV